MKPNLSLSENALTVIKKRYLIKGRDLKPIETPLQMFERVAKTVAGAEKLYQKNAEEIQKIETDFLEILTNLDFLPNSPTFTGAGTKLGQLSACFVLPIEDDMTSILQTQMNMGLIHKSGGGTGFSFSRLRPKNDVVGTTGGISCGPMGFMQMYNDTTEQIKQGGTRRGANMGILRVDHPDILEFIDYKEKEGTLSNFNISVTVTEKFMRALKNNTTYDLINPRTQKIVRKIKAKEVFDKIVKGAWKNGEPGIIFIDQMNKFNPTPELGEYEATNPCLADDSWILTSNGPKQIKDLIGKKFIAIVNGEKWKSAEKGFFQTGVKKVLKLKTIEGFELRLTENHLIKAESGWIECGMLKPNDKIVINNHQSFDSWKGEYNHNDGYLVGLLMGDGTIKKKQAVLSLWGANQKIRKIATDYLFSKPARKDFSGWTFVKERNEYRLSHIYLTKLAFKLGISQKNKFFTEEIEKTSSDFYRGFLRGLFDCDGSVQGNQKKGVSIRLAQSNYAFLQAAQRMLLRRGIFSKIYSNRRLAGEKEMPDGKGGLKKYIVKAQHELVIANQNILEFQQKINFENQNKREKLENLIKEYKRTLNRQLFLATVKELTKEKSEEVYDTRIPDKNAFDANGIYVHNCGEQILLPYESCNLGSINLAKMVKINGRNEKEIDWEKMAKTIKIAVRFLDNVIDANKYPLPEIEEITKSNRKIGLGLMGFADLLFQLELPYNSENGFKIAEKIIKFVSEKSREASIELAKKKGVFPNFEKSVWAERKIKMRNAAITTIAPTGTLSIIASCSSGIEPAFALAYTKTVMDGTPLLEINPYVVDYLKKKNLWSKEIEEKIKNDGSLKNTDLPEKIKNIFITAPEIAPVDHVKMQAAFQKHTDNAISKTINFPNEATEADVRKAYLLAYNLDCKGITIYRDGSRDVQVLTTGDKKTEKSEEPTTVEISPHIKPRPRPAVVSGTTEEIPTSLGDLYVTINEDNIGPFEVFARVGKSGGDAESMTEAIGRLISLSLRSGIEIKSVIKQLKGIRGSQPVWQNGTLVLSCPDAVGQALERYVKRKNTLDLKFENQTKKENPAQLNIPLEHKIEIKTETEMPKNKSICPECGGIIEHEEGCLICKGCGYSKCG